MKIEKIPNYRLAYLRHVGPYGEDNNELVENLKEWARKHDLLDDSAIIFGIAQDNPQITPSEKCRYDVCLVIPDDFQIDDQVNEEYFAGGTYAVIEVKHTTEEIQKAWLTVFADVSKQGYVYTNEPISERYSMEMINQHLCEICVPIV